MALLYNSPLSIIITLNTFYIISDIMYKQQYIVGDFMNKLQENISLTKLGGLNNSNYLVTLQNSKYVLRIPSRDNTNNFYNENEIIIKIPESY